MEFLKKYWWIALLVIILVVYFYNKERIGRYLGVIKGYWAPSWASCNKTFFAKIPDGKVFSVFKADEGTTANPVAVYYKNEVTLVEGGISESGTPGKITKEEYDGLCKYFYNPPYAWYTDEYASQPIGHRI